jgi:hypothetical protein
MLDRPGPPDTINPLPGINHRGVAPLNDNEFQDEDELSPEERAEEDRKDAELAAELQPFIDAGWKHEASGWWVDPNDPERRLIIDPFTHEIIYSAKYWEPIKAELVRRRQAGEL